jgi:tetratricopeptide (TPR) repeat protein
MRVQVLVLIFCVAISACKQELPTFQAPLLKNIGEYQVQVTTKSPYAQTFFNQGIIMANNFNHAEAERSFREAVRLDPDFAMGYWGIAYVLGPNFNSASNMGTINEIRDAVAEATRLGEKASRWEQAVIKAIATKFPSTSANSDDEAFSNAMREAYEEFPENSIVATLYAESVMNLHPWDFYEKRGGEPRPWTPEVVALLEKVIAIDPQNPLANHLYLHATEASGKLDQALVVSERLKDLVPSAGHLVHMPSHIYINTGDYHEGSIANEKAVLADSTYIAECKAQGYYPQMYFTHNYHFLAATAAFEGRASRSIEAAFKTASLVDPAFSHEPGFEMVQHYMTIPYHILIKFAQWEKIKSLPEPTEDLIYPRAIWHYAQGMALAQEGKNDQAKTELEQLRTLGQDSTIADQMNWGINKVTEVCQIAARVLEAKVLVNERKNDAAKKLLSEAIIIEDGLNYNEPPDWFFSVRHILGNLYLETGDFARADKIFREDLYNWPKNGFALSGLTAALMAQGKTEEAAQMDKQFQEAWKLAEMELKGSEIDPRKRVDVALKIDDNSPTELIYLAASVCIR